jgi:hypothetical protein
MLILVACPEPGCDAPAELTDQFVLPSTSGPIEHVRTYCLHRHILMMPTERLDRAERAAAGPS